MFWSASGSHEKITGQRCRHAKGAYFSSARHRFHRGSRAQRGTAINKNSEDTGRTATKPKATKQATAKKKTTAQKTSNSAVTKGAAAEKTSVTKKTDPKAAGPKKSAAKKGTRKVAQRIRASERHQMIAVAACLRAEAQRLSSNQREDWLMAEAEIDARLAKVGRKVID